MLAMEVANPLFWGVLIAWIMTVVLHEFAHGLAAYLGGDYTIRERGGLTLNPLQYIDPVFSLLLPAVFLLMGGVPLPGGATYIRHDLLRSRGWASAVAAAGPAMNLLLFLLCVAPFHPKLGWMGADWFGPRDNASVVLAALSILQIVAVLYNLVPVPPLDGFQILSPYMRPETRQKLSTPPLSTILFILFFMAVWQIPWLLTSTFAHVIAPTLHLLGFDDRHVDFFRRSYNLALFGDPH